MFTAFDHHYDPPIASCHQTSELSEWLDREHSIARRGGAYPSIWVSTTPLGSWQSVKLAMPDHFASQVRTGLAHHRNRALADEWQR